VAKPIWPPARGPVIPSRARTATASRSTPRPARGGAAQPQRRARGGVDLVPVVHLQDLDVEGRVERPGDLLDEAE
jgi:hypothetical protein